MSTRKNARDAYFIDALRNFLDLEPLPRCGKKGNLANEVKNARDRAYYRRRLSPSKPRIP